MNNPLQTAKQALESANEIIIHLLENHPTARHHRKTGEALRQVNDAIQAIAHAENLKSEKSIENNQANSFRGSPDHIADADKMVAETVKRPNLQPVINWLENGCDPKEAAKELRIYQERMNAAPVERQWVDLTDDELKAALEVHQVGLSVRIGRIAIAAFKDKNK